MYSAIIIFDGDGPAVGESKFDESVAIVSKLDDLPPRQPVQVVPCKIVAIVATGLPGDLLQDRLGLLDLPSIKRLTRLLSRAACRCRSAKMRC